MTGVEPGKELWPFVELLFHDTSLFRRLVLGWIEADFRIQIRIFSLPLWEWFYYMAIWMV